MAPPATTAAPQRRHQPWPPLLLLPVLLLLAINHCAAFQPPPQPPTPPQQQQQPPRSSPPPKANTIDRRTALPRPTSTTAAAAALLLLLQPPAQPARADSREAIAKAAAKIPGYGPPDTLYPPFFAGEWLMTREGAGLSLANPAEEDKVDPDDLKQARAWATERVQYPVRFLPYEEDGGAVIADRGGNEAALWRARAGRQGKGELYLDAITPRWDRSNPNVLTVGFPDGVVLEVKVTKRSVEQGDGPGGDTFGLTEFCRVAEARQDTGVASIPRVSAVRVLQRWKRTGPETIEGLELVKYYPPVGLDPNPAAVMTLKSRLRLERPPQP